MKSNQLLPFLIQSKVDAVQLFELEDGRFQLLESVRAGPFLDGPGYLLVERSLAEFLKQQNVERVTFDDAILFDRPSGAEFHTHVRVRVRQYFAPDQIRDLDLAGPRLLTMNDMYYFVSPSLHDLLEQSSFDYLIFSEGLTGFAATES